MYLLMKLDNLHIGRVQRSLIFSSLSCGQAVAKMYWPGSHFYEPEKFSMFYSAPVISKKNFPENFYLPVGQVKDKFH